MAKEIVSKAITNGDSTNPIQVSVVPIAGDPTKNGLVIVNADGSSISGGGGGGTSKVKVSSVDTTEDFLGNKLVAGTDISLTASGAGNEKLTIAYTGSGGGTDEKVKYDAGDPTAGYVADKIIAGTGISVAEGSGANENKLVVTNSAPDQIVALTAGTNITSITGTYPNFTVNAATQTTDISSKVTGPATNTDSYIPQWDGANSKTLKDGIPTSTFQAALGYTAENAANKENSTIDTSTTKYPTVNLLKTGLDAKQNTMTKAAGSDVDTGTDDAKYVTSKAIADSKVSYTDGTEILTNKTFDDEFRGKQIATPSNPSSGYNKLYFKSDNKLYSLTSAGTEAEIGAGGGGVEPIRIRIPGELVADANNYQGVFRRNTTGGTITISNIKIKVATAAAGTGAAAAFNFYKSSGTDSNGINTSATALFSSAIDLTTNYTDDTNVPDTQTVEDGRWISMRVTASAGATNKASDVEAVIYYS